MCSVLVNANLMVWRQRKVVKFMQSLSCMLVKLGGGGGGGGDPASSTCKFSKRT